MQWQISWVNVQMILADAPRCLDEDEVKEQNVTTNELKSKDDIKNSLKLHVSYKLWIILTVV